MTTDEKKNELIAELFNSGFTQRAKTIFEKENVRVEMIDYQGVAISINLANGMELSVFQDWENVDISKIKAE